MCFSSLSVRLKAYNFKLSVRFAPKHIDAESFKTEIDLQLTDLSTHECATEYFSDCTEEQSLLLT